MDDVKLLGKKEKELETLIQTISIFNQYIEMAFGIEKCGMLIMKSGKWQITEGIELSNQERNKTLGEKKTYKCWRKLGVDTIK